MSLNRAKTLRLDLRFLSFLATTLLNIVLSYAATPTQVLHSPATVIAPF